MKRSFDNLARCYHALERITFGNRLQQARCLCLPYLSAARTALLIGDGDGRFSQALLKTHPSIRIDSIDSSAAMLASARQRLDADADRRFHPIHIDATRHSYPIAHYDFIGLHFCLDCFQQAAVDALLPKLVASLKPGGLIAYSDFTAERGKTLVWMLYRLFRLTTDIQAKRLPRINWPESLKQLERKTFVRGHVVAEIWRSSVWPHPTAARRGRCRLCR